MSAHAANPRSTDVVPANPAVMRPDVLIVGLGPAGASAAAAAAAAGCQVLAIDKRPVVGEPLQCAEFVSAALSLDAVSWDCLTLQPILRMVTRVEDGPPEVTEDFRGRMISRPRFDQALARYAIAQGARCSLATAVIEILPDGAIRLSSGVEIKARVLIGADGPRSRVGAAIAQINRDLVATRQVSAPLMHSHVATDIFLRAAYRGGYGWLFPKQRMANVGIGIDYSCRDRLKSLLRDLHSGLVAAGRLAPSATVQLTGGLIPVGGRLRVQGHLGGVGVLLAGDAAGLANPVTGAGIEAAVRSGQLAGIAAANWLGGHTAAIEDYEEELADLYDAAYARALRRRRDVLDRGRAGEPDAAALRRSWISSPEYWLEPQASAA